MKNKKIIDSVEKIQPAEGAEGRMYRNVLSKSKKAQKRATPAKIIKMALPIAACFCIAIIGVIHFWPANSPISDPNSSFLPNLGIQDGTSGYGEASLKDIEKLGYSINIPEEAESIFYSIYDGKIASVDFLLDNHSYTLCASDQTGDFSGLDGTIKKEVDINAKTNAKLYLIDSYTVLCWKARWTDGKNTYYLTNEDDADESDMMALCRMMSE